MEVEFNAEILMGQNPLQGIELFPAREFELAIDRRQQSLNWRTDRHRMLESPLMSEHRKLMTNNPHWRNSATRRIATEIIATDRARQVILERMD